MKSPCEKIGTKFYGPRLLPKKNDSRHQYALGKKNKMIENWRLKNTSNKVEEIFFVKIKGPRNILLGARLVNIFL